MLIETKDQELIATVLRNIYNLEVVPDDIFYGERIPDRDELMIKFHYKGIVRTQQISGLDLVRYS